MTPLQRYARFQLIVMAAALVLVGVLFVTTGSPVVSISGFALMALVAFRGLALRGRRSPIQDERDAEIVRQAGGVSYGVFWLCFVAWGVALTMSFQSAQRVPIAFIAPAVWVGLWILLTTRAIAILVLNRGLSGGAGETEA